MCIIVACENGSRPTKSQVETAFYNNPDGAGLMWVQDGRVMISKGYMYLADLARAIDSVPEDSPLVIHCRIGTSGGYGAEVTHPWCVTYDVDMLHCLDVEAPVGIAHNGVLPYEPDDRAGISDTMRYIMDVVYPLSQRPDVVSAGGLAVSRVALNTLKKTSAGSRLCVLDSAGHMARIGKGWETVSPGVYASNSSWRGFCGSLGFRHLAPTYASFEDCDNDPIDVFSLSTDCYYCDAYDDCKRWGPICDEPGEMAGELPSYDAPTLYGATLTA